MANGNRSLRLSGSRRLGDRLGAMAKAALLYFALRNRGWRCRGTLVVVAFVPTKDKQVLAQRVANALGVIAKVDAGRSTRIQRDIRAVLVWPGVFPGARGEFLAGRAICALDSDFVRTSDVSLVALTIVHEATHARLARSSYTDETAERIERICERQELAFISKLPGGELLVAGMQEFVSGPSPRNYTKAAQMEAGLASLSAAGIPRPLARLLRGIARIAGD